MSDAPDASQAGGDEHTDLARDLSLFDITMIGVGAMIGAGIFVLTGLAAGQAGPGIMMAFAFNGFITIFTGMVYAELGSAIPKAGGGYHWVSDALGHAQSFVAGWMSWFAHAVAGSLYALGFGSFVTLLLAEYFGVVPFGLAPPVLEKIFAVFAGVLFTYINFRGAKETGLAGNIVTLLKVTVIVAFVIAGLGVMAGEPVETVSKFEPFLPRGVGGVFIAMGLTFIAFEGYEIIVQSGEEVENPRENVPKAIFYAMIIVVTIYLLVAAVLLGAVDLTPELLKQAEGAVSGGGHAPGPGAGALPEDPALWQALGHLGELGLARAADQVLPAGTLVILVAGIFSTLSALNATTYSSTRVGFAMGRDRILPDLFASVHEETRTPHVSVAFSGALIIFMALALPIEDVAAATDVMFLLLFLQVNYAAIVIRREWGDEMEYGYLMPWFPYVPIIGIITKLFLAVYLFEYSPMAWYGAIGWITVGVGIFYLYSRPKVREEEIREETRLVAEDRAPAARGEQILVPIANPESAEPLVRLASTIAVQRDAELLLTSVVTVPEQTPLEAGREYVSDEREMLRSAMEHVPDDVPAHSTVTIGHDVGKSICNIADQRGSDLILVGWRGRRRRVADLVLGTTIDTVVEEAPCDVGVAKLAEVEGTRRILVPVGRGPHAELSAELAGAFLRDPDTELTLLRVTGDDEEAARSELETMRDELASEMEDVVEDIERRVALEVIEAEDVAEAILRYARDEADSIVLGATRGGLVARTLFGAIPERVGEAFDGPVLMVKRNLPVRSTLRRWRQKWFGRFGEAIQR